MLFRRSIVHRALNSMRTPSLVRGFASARRGGAPLGGHFPATIQSGFGSCFRVYSNQASASSAPDSSSTSSKGQASSSSSFHNSSAHFLDELTTQDKRDVLAVEEAYGNWWTNIKFRKGWATPPFQRAEVEHLLREAADYVVRIRKHMDSVCPGQKLRMRDGSAEDFFWSVNYNPLSHPIRFVRELVHATFKDAKGYVEFLDAETVDQYMTLIQRYCSSSHSSGGGGDAASSSKADSTLTSVQTGNPKVVETQELFNVSYQKLSTLGSMKVPVGVVATASVDEQWRKIQTTLSDLNKQFTELEASYQQLAEEEQKRIAQEKTEREAAVLRHLEEQQRRRQQYEAEQQAIRKKQEEERRKEQQQRQEEQRAQEDSTLLKIKEVDSEVIRAKTDIQRLVDLCDTLAVDRLSENKEQSAEILSALQDKCVDSSTKLMKDLLSLEGLLASTPEAREKKRAQTTAINEMLGIVEQLGYKLNALRQVVESARPPQSEPTQPTPSDVKNASLESSPVDEATAAQPSVTKEYDDQEKQPRAQSESETAPSSESTTMDVQKVERARQLRQKAKSLSHVVLQEDRWKALKFEPKFESEETPSSYVIKSYVPNIDRRNISVTISEDHRYLQISGFRIPSKQELQRLASALVEAVETGREDSMRFLELTEEQLLLSIAAGRFGTFSQQYRLPENVEVSGIEARYDERGMLSIIIPKAIYSRIAPQSTNFPAFGENPGRMAQLGNGQVASPRQLRPASHHHQHPHHVHHPHRRSVPTNFDDLFW